jgi:hypothetical protein
MMVILGGKKKKPIDQWWRFIWEEKQKHPFGK